ncbi:MAG: hypothetical protein HY721_24210 [Planctomycetes bacterium]|nr:hypothetical protein [Planctomycetota bacterium]
MKDIHLTLPAATAALLDRVARERDETRNGLIRLALERFLEAERKRRLSDDMKAYAVEMGKHSGEFVKETGSLVAKKLLKETSW